MTLCSPGDKIMAPPGIFSSMGEKSICTMTSRVSLLMEPAQFNFFGLLLKCKTNKYGKENPLRPSYHLDLSEKLVSFPGVNFDRVRQ
jgi:hypothetical protein